MSRAAIRYAKAILENAIASKNAEAVNNDMKMLNETISENRELKAFLSSPVIKQGFKKSAVDEIFAGVQKDTQSLFQLLEENSRFEIITQIATQYHHLYNESINLETAYVTTAFPISKEIETKVLEKVALFSTKNIIIKNIIDPTILGGFILRVGDKQYNTSVAYKLGELKRELID